MAWKSCYPIRPALGQDKIQRRLSCSLPPCHLFDDFPLLLADGHDREARQAHKVEVFQFCAGLHLRERDRPCWRRD